MVRMSLRCPAASPIHEHVPDITKGKILHVAGMEHLGAWGKPYWYIWFAEIPYPSGYNEAGFAAVEMLSNEALAELLEEAFTPVTA